MHYVGQAGKLVPILRAFASCLRDESVIPPGEAVLHHPALLTAFEVLASDDAPVLDAAVDAILASIDFCDRMGQPAGDTDSLCTFLLSQARASFSLPWSRPDALPLLPGQGPLLSLSSVLMPGESEVFLMHCPYRQVKVLSRACLLC